ncbi:hypothetical protein PSEUBRA_004968 [Kalmanozyma brasiliensis GHG001]|uniref:uncharacterized protein n=1 Tax=Kalmanozyma brasiliensis (strain GHG001) TaxID=1365824 RepID=UPI002868155C|nr:uncharacterized protein PSEUBRA_004968 [Kalmanozyma brasiliensis GHG001]KAF6767462.1 hypothetical protein PSEUBRA_004968 [Kalmanozyma brasiliensis GHG001]
MSSSVDPVRAAYGATDPSGYVASSSSASIVEEPLVGRTSDSVTQGEATPILSLTLEGTNLSARDLTSPAAFLSGHFADSEARLSFVGRIDLAKERAFDDSVYLDLFFDDLRSTRLVIRPRSQLFGSPFAPDYHFKDKDVILLKDVVHTSLTRVQGGYPYTYNVTDSFGYGLSFDAFSYCFNFTQKSYDTTFADVVDMNKRLDSLFFPWIPDDYHRPKRSVHPITQGSRTHVSASVHMTSANDPARTDSSWTDSDQKAHTDRSVTTRRGTKRAAATAPTSSRAKVEKRFGGL